MPKIVISLGIAIANTKENNEYMRQLADDLRLKLKEDGVEAEVLVLEAGLPNAS